jgi:hypothetical protein
MSQKRQMMNYPVIILDEPDLEFRYGQRVQDPHDGLSLFGPFDGDMPSHPGSLSYILLGTENGISKFKHWSEMMDRPSMEAPKGNVRLWPPFPGFEAVFHCKWPQKAIWKNFIDGDALSKASRHADRYQRVFQVCELYLNGIRKAAKLDENIGVAICIVPEEVWANCRPESHVSDSVGEVLSAKEQKSRKSGQLNAFRKFNPEQYKFFPDFRRQIKARSMAYGIPLQIIIESTLRPDDINKFGQRGLTPVSDRMWNLATAFYYKSGGKPWRLVTARDGVCYVGIAFRQVDPKSKGSRTACCAAQMFLNSGDGIVFLGEYGPWYSPKTKQFRLTRDAARALLEGVLKTYADLEGKELKEIFLHSRSNISAEEFMGYREACPQDVSIVGIKVHTDRNGLRLYRPGGMPVIRGTFWKINESSGLLWGHGFKPRLETYNGSDIPASLRIEIQHGDACIERVAEDIFGLTKLNYNACRLGEAEPVTIGFSDAVGEILISNPTVSSPRPNFKYYI